MAMIFWLQDRAQGSPRFFAGVWFMVVEFIVVMIPILFFFGDSTVNYSSANSIFFIADPALAGLAAGALLGAEIIVRPMNGGRAAIWGILTVLAAYMFTMLLTGLSNFFTQGSFAGYIEGIMIYFYPFIAFSIPLIVIGSLAGWLLHRAFRKPANRAEYMSGE